MATPSSTEESPPLKLLSLDGGGIRGIASLIILKYLMKRVNPANPPKPCDYFDLIGGTSTGGIIAIMLGRLRMDVQDCIDKYIELSSAAFSPRRSKANLFGKARDKWEVSGKYRSDVLAKEIQNVVQEYVESKDPEAKLYDRHTAACKVFVCAFTKARNTPVLLRSYTTEDSVDSLSTSDCVIWKAARATSAAATFFDPMEIGRQTFVDGATGMNNPVEQVLEEAKSIWPDAIAKGRIQCLLSIGTGLPDLKKFGDNLKEVVETLKEIAVETEKTETRFFKNHELLGLGGRYFRFNVNKGLCDIQLDDHEKLAEIEASAEYYLDNPRERKLIDEFRQAKAPMASLLDELNKNAHLTWLETVEPLEQHNDARKYRTVDSTGDWFLDHSFKHWKIKSKSFVWLTGKPGSGKTVLSSTIIDKLEEDPEANVLYYYFSFRQESKQDVTKFKRSLLMQLVRHLTREDEVRKGYFHVPHVFQKLYKKYSHSQFPLDEHINATMAGLLSESKQTYIVVDAVDECPSQVDQATIISFLGDLCRSSHGGAHVLVTSRRESNIETSVTNLDIDKEKVLMDTEKINIDIKSYLLDSLGRQPWKSWPARLKKKVAKTLTSKADGVFRWAALQLESLRDKERDKDVESALQSLPKNLEETYEVMLKRIESAERSTMAMMILQWLAYAKRPLQLSEMAEIAILEMEYPRGPGDQSVYTVTFRPEDRFRSIWSARKILSGLITISGIDDRVEVPPDQDGAVSFSHFTVQEYLQGDNVSPRHFRLEEEAANLCILRGCLGYLAGYERSTNRQKDSVSATSTLTHEAETIEDESDSSSEFDFPELEHENLQNDQLYPFPLLLYAAKYWSTHASSLSYSQGADHTIESMKRAPSDLLDMVICIALSERAKGTAELPSKLKDALLNYVSSLDLDPSRFLTDRYYGLDFESPTALHNVCDLGDNKLFQLFLDAGVDLNHADPHNRARPIHRAVNANYNSISMVTKLVERGATLDHRDKRGRTPLSLAAELGLTDVAQYLVGKGADMHITDTDITHISIQPPEVRRMHRGFTIFSGFYAHVATHPGKGWEPLHWAIENDHSETAQFLIEAGCNIMESDVWGPCPLSLAIIKKDEAVVRAMINKDKTAVLSQTFGNKWSALHVAAAHRNRKMLEILLSIGMDVEARDSVGRSAMDMAAIGARELAYQSLPSMYFGSRDWHYGIGSSSEAIKLLSEHRGSLGSGGPYLSSPLHYASLFGQEDAIQALLDCGAEVNVRNSAQWTPLLHASTTGNGTAIKLLLKNGAEVDATDDKGLSALMIACGNGHHDAAKILLDAGADRKLKALDGRTALDEGRKRKNAAIIKMLTGNDIYENGTISSLESDSEVATKTIEGQEEDLAE